MNFTKKRNTKQYWKEKKYQAIFRDYCNMFKNGKTPEQIHKALSNKYFLDTNTIYRVILSKTVNNGAFEGVP